MRPVCAEEGYSPAKRGGGFAEWNEELRWQARPGGVDCCDREGGGDIEQDEDQM